MRSKLVPQSWNGNSVSIQLHTHTYTHVHKDEHLTQNGLFSQCSKASITARAGILIIQSITAAQQSLLPVLLMGHLLSCSILTPVHLTCTDDCYAQNDNKNLFFFFAFAVVSPFDEWSGCFRTPLLPQLSDVRL